MFVHMTLQQYYQQYLQQLQTLYDTGEATAIADWVWEVKAGLKKRELADSGGQLLTAELQASLSRSLLELMQQRPVQYVLGETFFYQLPFKVTEQVLIPRPETEELVHWIISDHKNNPDTLSVLDIGTGSGCIPVALKKNLPGFTIAGTDVSESALAVARENAQRNQTGIAFILADLLNSNDWELLPRVDIIVSNPPYIPLHEKEKMPSNVTSFEPGIALFVPDQSPLLFYETIATLAKTHLKPGGKIYLEIHQDLAMETADLFRVEFQEVDIRKDINGNNRMLKITRSR